MKYKKKSCTRPAYPMDTLKEEQRCFFLWSFTFFMAYCWNVGSVYITYQSYVCPVHVLCTPSACSKLTLNTQQMYSIFALRLLVCFLSESGECAQSIQIVCITFVFVLFPLSYSMYSTFLNVFKKVCTVHLHGGPDIMHVLCTLQPHPLQAPSTLQGSSPNYWFMFVYVGFVNKDICFCYFIKHAWSVGF